MAKSIEAATLGIDVLLILVDASKITGADFKLVEKYQNIGVPIVLAINKVDIASYEKVYPSLAKFNEMKFISDFVSISAKEGKNVTDKGNAQKYGIGYGDGIYHNGIHIGKQNHSDQTDKQHGGTQSSGKNRAGKRLAPAEMNNEGDQLKDLLCQEHGQNRMQNGILQGKTQGQGKLGGFIRERIQQLSHIGDHIIPPGDHHWYPSAVCTCQEKSSLYRSFQCL